MFTNCVNGQFRLDEMDVNAIHPMDSVTVDPGGNILFKFKPTQAGFYILRFPDKKKIILLLDTNETLEIKGDCDKPAEDLLLQGSPGTLLLADFFRETSSNRKAVDSLKLLIHEHEGRPDFLTINTEADDRFRKIISNQRAIELRFLQKNPNSLACLIVLNYTFDRRQPILDIDQDLRLYQQVDSSLTIHYPNNKHLKYHHQRILEQQRQQSAKQNELQGQKSKN